MRQFDGISLAKAVLWEEAKGKLRAIAMAEGAAFGEIPKPNDKFKYEYIEEFIENFISEFELEGYHE